MQVMRHDTTVHVILDLHTACLKLDALSLVRGNPRLDNRAPVVNPIDWPQHLDTHADGIQISHVTRLAFRRSQIGRHNAAKGCAHGKERRVPSSLLAVEVAIGILAFQRVRVLSVISMPRSAAQRTEDTAHLCCYLGRAEQLRWLTSRCIRHALICEDGHELVLGYHVLHVRGAL